jgi:DnaJ-class molecular chaperone
MDLNETADVNITLTTSITEGTVYINTILDKNLETDTQFDSKAKHTIQANQQNVLMNFQVQAKQEGLFYIRLLTTVETKVSKKLRTFAVPVYVGQQNKPVAKSLTTSLKAIGSSENISVSKAKETIQVIKEK